MEIPLSSQGPPIFCLDHCYNGPICHSRVSPPLGFTMSSGGGGVAKAPGRAGPRWAVLIQEPGTGFRKIWNLKKAFQGLIKPSWEKTKAFSWCKADLVSFPITLGEFRGVLLKITVLLLMRPWRSPLSLFSCWGSGVGSTPPPSWRSPHLPKSNFMSPLLCTILFSHGTPYFGVMSVALLPVFTLCFSQVPCPPSHLSQWLGAGLWSSSAWV